MPQMSPMNWIMILNLILLNLMNIKMKLSQSKFNYLFLSSTMNLKFFKWKW